MTCTDGIESIAPWGGTRRPQHTIGIIWAQDNNGVIGSGTGMLWHVPDDFAYFKLMTLNHPIIMGRASWEALGSKALPGRSSIVLTRQDDYHAEGASVVGSLDEAIDLAKTLPGGEMMWIAGGGHVYEEAIDRADVLHVSRIDLEVPSEKAHAFAPKISEDIWKHDESSDAEWRTISGDARWRVDIYRRRQPLV